MTCVLFAVKAHIMKLWGSTFLKVIEKSLCS